VREYGHAGPLVIVLHGGPGAPGQVVSLARGLARWFRVLEPFQRRSGGVPLTVGIHIADLRDVIASRAGGERPALVGSSWGAMLALAFAAGHPGLAGPLVLVGCGTFDRAARARLEATIEARMTRSLRDALRQVETGAADPDRRMQAIGRLIDPLYTFDAVEAGDEGDCDARGHRETWSDMLELQARGVYPAAFRAITSPVLMLHGTYDPHPGRMIVQGLRHSIPHIEYREWERCGHYPWIERAVRQEFYETVRNWLASRCAASVEGAEDSPGTRRSPR
jgi:pimeloyl-ACP methyl ester carboxylesterase